jgi:hypothetical protein
MTVIFEVSRPYVAKPGHFRSRVVDRWWWLWFAVTVVHVPMKEFAETSYRWIDS